MAYVFMVAAYALLWLGGVWMRRAYRHDVADLARWVARLGVSASLCFFLTNTSFYWLGGRISDPTFGGWWQNFAQWYPGFIAVPFVYVGIAVLLHAMLARPVRTRLEADVY
jgi:hypothetical protein